MEPSIPQRWLVRSKKISTIDPIRDTLAKEDAETIPDQLQTLIAEESSEDQKEVLADYQANIDRPRKVDFIFLLPIRPADCAEETLCETGNFRS